MSGGASVRPAALTEVKEEGKKDTCQPKMDIANLLINLHSRMQVNHVTENTITRRTFPKGITGQRTRGIA